MSRPPLPPFILEMRFASAWQHPTGPRFRSGDRRSGAFDGEGFAPVRIAGVDECPITEARWPCHGRTERRPDDRAGQSAPGV